MRPNKNPAFCFIVAQSTMRLITFCKLFYNLIIKPKSIIMRSFYEYILSSRVDSDKIKVVPNIHGTLVITYMQSHMPICIFSFIRKVDNLVRGKVFQHSHVYQRSSRVFFCSISRRCWFCFPSIIFSHVVFNT